MKPELLPTTPQPIASDTWLIPTLGADPAGGYVGAHSVVINGREPVIVDTSVLFGRDAWLQNVFSVLEPEDVRWIFLSHDDHDHLGNLDAVLDLCPHATLLANYAMVGRLAGDIELPLERMRWLNVGESIDLGDRQLVMVRPPMFDSPATRGFLDTRTGMLWAVDSFGSEFPGAVYDADDIPADVYDPSFVMLNSLNTPWLEWSHECGEVAYLDGSTGPRPGARFRGRNRVGRSAWTRTCEIVSVEDGHSISWRTIPSRLHNDSTVWTIAIEPAGSGTRIVQSYEVVKLSALMDHLIWRFVSVHRDRRAALTEDLRRIGDAAATSVG
jgi:hypothetical protein